MTYSINPNIPASANNPSDDQPIMQQNFAAINSFLGVDHTAPGTTPTAGQHAQVRFTTNQSAPGLASAVCELFANVGPSLSQLWFSNGVGNPVQMTGIIPTNSGSDYGIITPFGLILNWGNVAGVGPGGVPVTFAVPFNSLQSINLTNENTTPDSFVSVSNLTNDNFIARSSVNHTLYYFAIGV